MTSVAAAAALAIYLVATLPYLDRAPVVGQDEPWIAAPGYKLATQGIVGSDMFTGFHGMERHDLIHPPLYAVLEAAIFRELGAGVIQMRILSVLFGLGVLLMVYVNGRELGGERVGALAVLLIVTLRLAAPTEVRPIGILLLDDARINRFDIAVPAFGLGALWALACAARRPRPASYFAAGGLVGFSTLSHLFGAFWLPALASVLCVRNGLGKQALRPVSHLLAGFALVVSPWAVWIFQNWSDYLGQMSLVAGRLRVFTPAFYIENIFSGDGPISVRWMAATLGALPPWRVGTWTVALGTPVALALLWQKRRERPAMGTAVPVVLAIQFLLVVTLLQVKTFNYVIALWPLAVLALSWLGVELWDRRAWPVRAALLVLAVAISIEGGGRLVSAARQARTTSTYDAYEEQIARCVPAGARVLGFQHYWLGLRQFDYRTWLLPIYLSNPDYEAEPIPFDSAIDSIEPDIILIDRVARQLFAETADPSHQYHYLSVGYEAFRAGRQLERGCVVENASYGTMEVFEVRR